MQHRFRKHRRYNLGTVRYYLIECALTGGLPAYVGDHPFRACEKFIRRLGVPCWPRTNETYQDTAARYLELLARHYPEG